jgi:HAD superfamily hydrolase (TIGR01490 family)
MILALFDLDGTLYTGHITRGVMRHHQLHRVKLPQLYSYLAIHMPLWYLHRAHLLPEEPVRTLWIRNLGWVVRGWTPAEAASTFEWMADEYVRPRLCPEVMARLRDHQSRGHRVIIVSGTFSPMLEEIGRRLGAEETVGTPLVMKNGRYTGACETPACQGPGKVSRLEAYLGDGEDVTWSQSYAYADSHTDIPLLQRVGHPVAVNPDPRLEDLARSRGWEILRVEQAGSAQ